MHSEKAGSILGLLLIGLVLSCGRTHMDTPAPQADSSGGAPGLLPPAQAGEPGAEQPGSPVPMAGQPGAPVQEPGALSPKPTAEGGLCAANGWCWVRPVPFGHLIADVHGTTDDAAVFAVGKRGAILEHNTAGWNYHDASVTMDLAAVHVSAPNDVWVGGTDGFLHYDGVRWSATDALPVQEIQRTESGQLWAIIWGKVHRAEGSQWIDVSPNSDLWFSELVPGPGAAELWTLGREAVGRQVRHVLFRYDGSEWTEEPGGPPVDYPTLTLVRAGADIFACGSSGIWRASGGWELVDPQFAGTVVWGDESGTLFLASGLALERWDATGRATHAALNATAVWGTPSGQLWLALRNGGLARLDRTGARQPTIPEDAVPAPSLTEPEAAWGSVPPDVWARATSWGSGPTDVWRSSGTALEHFDGSAWTPVIDYAPVAIDGSAADNVWFTFFGSSYASPLRMLHWNGQEVRDQVLPEEWIGYRIEAVRSFDFGDTWIAARDPTRARICRFDGTRWTVVREIAARPGFGEAHFRALEGLSSQDVWVMDRDGVSHFDGSAWSTPLLAAPKEQFLSLAVDERDVWVLGTHNTYVRKDGSFQAQPFIHDVSKIALTGDHVWAYTGSSVMRRPR